VKTTMKFITGDLVGRSIFDLRLDITKEYFNDCGVSTEKTQRHNFGGSAKSEQSVDCLLSFTD
jgi:hypothetical protein